MKTPKEDAEELIQDARLAMNISKDAFRGNPVWRERAIRIALVIVDRMIIEGATQYGATAVDNGRESHWYGIKKELTK